MIADLDDTIKQLLVAEMPIRNSEIDVSFDQPKREWSARLTKPTVNLFLYDVRENVELRQFQWQRVDGGNGRTNKAALKRPPLRLDCHYMITTWAAEPEDEHRLLTRTLLVLFGFAKLPRERLVGRLQDQEFEITAKLASHDKLTNSAEIWSALDNELRPTVSYLVTVMLDPWTPIEEPMVRSLSMAPNWLESFPENEEAINRERHPDKNGRSLVAGTVRVQGAEADTIAGAQIHVQGTGMVDTTDENGRFAIRGLRPGRYTFAVTGPTGETAEVQFAVPAPDGNYDIDLAVDAEAA